MSLPYHLIVHTLDDNADLDSTAVRSLCDLAYILLLSIETQGPVRLLPVHHVLRDRGVSGLLYRRKAWRCRRLRCSDKVVYVWSGGAFITSEIGSYQR